MPGPSVIPFAQVHETHTGVVLLLGDRAYKVKKPVDLGFCDFTSVAERDRVCRREVELNRRLAPEAYLGVAELHLPDGHATEPVIVMRRMPPETRLATLAREGRADGAVLTEIARRIADFHAGCDRRPDIDADATVAAIRANWASSIAELRELIASWPDAPLGTDDVDAIEAAAIRYLDGRTALFDARIAAGAVVDGHGDLLADDIFLLPEGPQILDCLEFDDHLRHVDRIDDIAFLAMDLERLGAPELGRLLLTEYRRLTGDDAPASLVHHYQAYRALVRAKVTCVRARQGDPEAPAAARALAQLCRDHLAAGTVRLILVGGLPGTGKSTLAHAIAADLDCTVISTDRVRKELAGLDPDTPAPAGYGDGLYAPEHIAATYAAVMERAEALLTHGRSVILDGSWTSAAPRAQARDLAERTAAVLVGLQCVAPAEVADARMVGRRGPSDANAEIAAAMRANADPWSDAVPVDTGGELADAHKHAVDVVLGAL
ncbi:AAA family ATPase [Sporichthya brevicatena]|uniref:AAA family ATPase n=1 Tax=Sporichthya brevicatena TaxID=171442 RepID=A0ABP3SGD3_9ACTN